MTLVGGGTPTNAEQPRTETLRRLYKCEIDQAARLDDGMSDAQTIARGVLGACREALTAMEREAAPTSWWAPDFQVRTDQGVITTMTAFILEQRAKKRGTKGAPAG